MRVYLEGIGLCGPGLNGWGNSRAILAGREPYIPAPALIPPSSLLPPNERRRAAQIVKIALSVSAEAFAAAGRNAAKTATVFSSSGGDGDTIHEILKTLASPQRELSPTRFHNSVHNSAAGYWSIATGARAASTSLCCHDDSFAAGLLEAAVQVETQHHAVALIAYDVPYPFPLNEIRPIGAIFAAALILSPTPEKTAIAAIELTLQQATAAPQSAIEALEPLRQTTPAARCLPLLSALARQESTVMCLNYLDNLTLLFDIACLSPS